MRPRNIKFTCEESKEKVSFLDVVLKIKNERLSADLNSKPAISNFTTIFVTLDI